MALDTHRDAPTFPSARLPALRTAVEANWNPTQTAWRPVAILLVLCAALFFHGLNVGELYRTEALRAIIAAEFLHSGNWIVPKLYNEPLLTKPPGMYAAIAAASWPWGEVTEWTARLPSAVAATTLVLLFYWYTRRQLGRLGGLIVAAITPCGLLWLDKGSTAEIDMLQTAWTGAALLFVLRALDDVHAEGSERPMAFRWWLAALLCVAGGVLTKWTAAAFFYTALIPLLAWRRQLRLLFSWQHLVSAAVAAALCCGWISAVIHQVGWEAFYASVYSEAAPRLSHDHHLGENQLLGTLLHPLKLWAANLPWSAFALVTFWPGFWRLWDARGQRLLQACHCWAWPNVLLWTLLPDHATRHGFPLFPGMVGLGALVWVSLIEGRLPVRLSRWLLAFALLGLACFGAAALGGSVAGFWKLPSSSWWLLVIFAALAAWCVREGFNAWRAARLGGLLMSIVLTWVILKFAVVHFVMPIRSQARQPRQKAALLAEHVPPGEFLYVFSVKDEGIMFYYRRPVHRLKGPKLLPRQPGPVYCVVMEHEHRVLRECGDWRIVLEVPFRDQQGDPTVLLGLEPDAAEPGQALALDPSEQRTKLSSLLRRYEPTVHSWPSIPQSYLPAPRSSASVN